MFPEFRRLVVTDGPLFHKLLREYPPIISEYTFSNLFAWMHQYDFHISRHEDTLLVLTKHCGQGGLYPPVGPVSGNFLFNLLKESKINNVADHYHCADERITEALSFFKADVEIKEEPDQFDYIYSREDMANLPGNRFHDKKNLLNQFERKYDASFEPLTTTTVEEALNFEHDWCKTRECEKTPSLSREQCAIYNMLSYFEIMKLGGALVRCNGKIIGITMGEPLNDDTYVIHIEKGDDSYRGIYQFINQRFAASIDPKYKWINREQDLGIPGLRRAKQSYNPVRMAKKYTVHLKR
jgi:hypothetical protein